MDDHRPIADRHRQPPGRWPLVQEETLGRYTIFSLSASTRRSPVTGRTHRFVRLDPADWVNVVALTGDGRVVLVEQYRHGTDELTLEIPGGAVDPGEAPEVAARRELEEETGLVADELVAIGAVRPNPAFLSNTCWTYLALGCREGGTASPDPTEELAVHLTTLDGFTALIDERRIDHSLVLAAHDHLRRGLVADLPWAARVRAAVGG
jgi:8-oxo-dGTP pyrophosphatase MutT (NUDIX family)